MTAPRNIGSKIHQLRSEGKSYFEICSELQCSKGTVSYHVGKGVKKKQQQYKRDHQFLYTVCNKIENFSIRSAADIETEYLSKLRKRTVEKKLKFRNRGIMAADFTYEELMEKIGDNPKCYITGDPIDLADTRSWHLDHIVPVSKGGSNSLDNCNIASKTANMSKSDMTPDEFFAFCKRTLEHNGFSVEESD
tara:strand:+ start:2701 stop:3276 length:576 start_codon:yes stop_codon:yes gene_type:complete